MWRSLLIPFPIVRYDQFWGGGGGGERYQSVVFIQDLINPRQSIGQQLLIFHPEMDGDNPNLGYGIRISPVEYVVFRLGFGELNL